MKWIFLLALFPILGKAEPNYVLKDLENYSQTWVGNTFPGGEELLSPNNRSFSFKHIPYKLADVHVEEDGTLYTNSEWVERGAQVAVYKDGDQILIADSPMGWKLGGGYAVTTDADFIYATVRLYHFDDSRKPNGVRKYPEKGSAWYGFRVHRKSDGSTVKFEQGRGKDGDVLVVSADSGPLYGLAEREGELFVSDTANHRIRVYDTDSLSETPLRSFAVNLPHDLTFDDEGLLWVLMDGGTTVAAYTVDGTRLKSFPVHQGAVAHDLDVGPDGRLWLVDDHPDSQIKIFAGLDQTPYEDERVGTPGGVFANSLPGSYEPLSFYKPSFVGVDGKGRFYVNAIPIGGTSLQAYSKEKDLLWDLHGNLFVEVSGQDPEHPYRLFGERSVFHVHSLKDDGSQWSYQGISIDPETYPEDPRLWHRFHGATRLIRLKGKTFMMVFGLQEFAMWRIPDGQQISIPYMFYAQDNEKGPWPIHEPEDGEWLWVDTNLDGQMDAEEFNRRIENPNQDAPHHPWGVELTESGDFWTANNNVLRKWEVGFRDGYPVWTYANVTEYPVPADMNHVRRVLVEEAEDALYISGYTDEFPFEGEWKAAGKVLRKITDYAGAHTTEFDIELPWDSSRHRFTTLSYDVEAGKIFSVLASQDKWSDDSKNAAAIHVWDATSGDLIGTMHRKMPHGRAMVDMAYSLTAIEQKDGSVLVFLEDDGHIKNLLFHLPANPAALP
jgi:hypothetical protein